jgi:hypothetical protein
VYASTRSIGKTCENTGLSLSMAREKLQNEDIQARISEISKDTLAEAKVTEINIIAELGALAFSNISDVVEISAIETEQGTFNRIILLENIPDNAKKAIKKITVSRFGDIQIEMHSKTDALEKLAKYLELYKEKVEVINVNGGEIDELRQKIIGRVLGHVRPAIKGADIERFAEPSETEGD